MTASESLKSRYPSYVMVLIRLLFGYLWYGSVLWKNPPRFGLDTGADFYFWVDNVVKHSHFAFGVTFFKAVVLPNFLFFGWLIFFLECALTVSFALGLKTRVLAAVAALFTFNMYLGSSGIPNEWPWSYLLMTMVSLALVAHDTSDTVLSVDYWLKRRAARTKPAAALTK